MTRRAQIRVLGLFLVLTLLSGIFLSVPLAFTESNSSEAMLEIGPIVSAKIKALATIIDAEKKEKAYNIKAIRMADWLPDGFVPSDANTVSSLYSEYPIYIFFDNTDDAGIIYFYTEGNTIVMNPYSSSLFSDYKTLTDISGVSDWDASQVTNMNALFYGAKALSDIDALKNWNTLNVTSMCALFNGAANLTNALALKNWNTSNVTDMSYMFSGATSLEFVDVTNWNTSKVKNMSCMFQVGNSWKADGQLIEIIGLGDLDVSNVTDMTCMFYGAGKMTYYDISRWDVSRVESMNHMFCDNRSLVSLDLSNWDVSSLKTIFCMFDDNVSLKTIGDVSHWNTSNLIDAGGWLNECSSFIGDKTGTLDLSGWNTSNLKAAGEMLLNNSSLHIIDLTGWTFDSVTNDKWEGTGRGIYYETGNNADSYKGLGGMFKGCKKLTAVYVSQSGLDSFSTAIERGVNTLDIWTRSKTDHFTVK